MRISDADFTRQSLRNINNIYSKLDDLRLSIATGQRIRNLSEDPPALFRALEAQGDMNKTTQFIANIDSLDAYSTQADISLGVMEELFIRVRETSVRTTETINTGDRNDLAMKLNSEMELFLSEANQNYEGEYIFSGTAVKTKPFDAVYSGDNIVYVNYKGDSSHQKREIGEGLFVEYNVNGEDILGGVKNDSNPFEVMMSLRDNIMAGTITSTRFINLPGTTIDPSVPLNTITGSFIKAPDDNGGTGTVRINGVDIAWNDTESIQDIVNNINAAGAGATARFDTARQKLLITPDDVEQPVKIEDISGNFSDFTYTKNAPKMNNEFLDIIDSSFHNLLSLRTKVGIVGERLEETRVGLENSEDHYQEVITDEAGTDLPRAIIDMLAYEKTLEGALNVSGRMHQMSLMDFLG